MPCIDFFHLPEPYSCPETDRSRLRLPRPIPLDLPTYLAIVHCALCMVSSGLSRRNCLIVPVHSSSLLGPPSYNTVDELTESRSILLSSPTPFSSFSFLSLPSLFSLFPLFFYFSFFLLTYLGLHGPPTICSFHSRLGQTFLTDPHYVHLVSASFAIPTTTVSQIRPAFPASLLRQAKLTAQA